MRLNAGDRFGPYVILSSIGAGGMGEVYRARDTRLGRLLALKLIAGDRMARPELRARFEREARAVAALTHPNVVVLYGIEHVDDVAVLAMELVDGRTLAEIITPRGLPIDQFFRIAIPISDALAAAHARGILHRDLKPANVMVTSQGHPKVLDFGLAKMREGLPDDDTHVETETVDGGVIGTVAYMSPEQTEGRPLDARSDVFSLGIVLYEALTGTRPFKGESHASIVSSILRDTPASVDEVRADLPPALGRTIDRALAKDPEHRFQSMKDLKSDLESLQADWRSGRSAARGSTRSRRSIASRRRRVAIGSLVLIVLAVTAALVYRQRHRAETTMSSTFGNVRVDRIRTGNGIGLAAAISPDGQAVAYPEVDELGHTRLWLAQIATGSRLQILDGIRERVTSLTFSPTGSHLYYYAFAGGQAQTVGSVHRIPAFGGLPERVIPTANSGVAVSADDRRLAYLRVMADQSTELVVCARDGSNPRRLATTRAPDTFVTLSTATPSWSADSQLIAAIKADGVGARLVTVDTDTGEIRTIGNPWNRIHSVAWAPSQRALLIAAAEQHDTYEQIWEIEYPSGRPRRLTNDLAWFAHVGVSAEGSRAVAVRATRPADIWIAPAAEPQNVKQVTFTEDEETGIGGVAWTPSGGLVMVSWKDGLGNLWMSDTLGAPARQLTNTPFGTLAPVVTRDGRTVVFLSATGPSDYKVWAIGADGSNATALSPGPNDGYPILSPDGRTVLYFSQTTATEYEVPVSGGASRVRVAPSNDRLCVGYAVSPEGSDLLCIIEDLHGNITHLEIRSFDGTRPPRSYAGRPDNVPSAVWHPNGRSFWYVSGGELWEQSVSERTASRRVATFKPQRIAALALSHDGRTIAYSLGRERHDVVLLSRTVDRRLATNDGRFPHLPRGGATTSSTAFGSPAAGPCHTLPPNVVM